MNSDKHSARAIRGNAMIYILIALGLLGALTVVLTRQNNQGGSGDLDADRTELLASQIMTYTTTVKAAIDQMTLIGTPVSAIDFDRPSDVNFDTAPYTKKLYHPEGGALSYSPPNPGIFVSGLSNPDAGWYVGRFNNVDWTPTTAQDVVLTAWGVNSQVCALLNKKITGSTTIPALSSARSRLVNVTYHSTANANFTPSDCAACEEKPSLCVSTDSGAVFVFYSVISAQ
ncbi:MAG: hypothetical protein DI626_00860 [Micavibrio aeruginosavorus]|uniref:Uncharacterized protein n=1 Tax=Micavibrio aeruginosavorus TaxID=349221 RepID=A0A2W5C0F7_9BACT|nr:MAG: hypothetical protein DI626_00860 [Micavibrio aeruginosavorus]